MHPRLWPWLLDGAPTAYSVFGGTALALTVPGRLQLEAMFELVRDTRVLFLDKACAQINSLLKVLCVLERSLPAATLKHRLSWWMEVGVDLFPKDVLSALDVPMLVVAGPRRE